VLTQIGCKNFDDLNERFLLRAGQQP
jgi:hypothetical protein